MQFYSSGQFAHGFIAVGQQATGVIAIGQDALGIVAIGQMARGVFAIGQLAFGVFTVGMLGVGLVQCYAIMGLGGRGRGFFVLKLFPPLHPKVDKDAPAYKKIGTEGSWFERLYPVSWALFGALALVIGEFVIFRWYHAMTVGVKYLDGKPFLRHVSGPGYSDWFWPGMLGMFLLGILLLRTSARKWAKLANRKEQAIRDYLNHLRDNGVQTEAVITSLERTGVRVNKRPKMRVHLVAELEDGQKLNLEFSKLMDFMDAPRFQPGVSYPLTYDKHNPKHYRLHLDGKVQFDMPESPWSFGSNEPEISGLS